MYSIIEYVLHIVRRRLFKIKQYNIIRKANIFNAFLAIDPNVFNHCRKQHSAYTIGQCR